jgi:hypothetical protein
MSRPSYYSPAIKRHLVTILYHEAKRQGRPMTDLTNEILERALRGPPPTPCPAQPSADDIVLQDDPPVCRSH